jgi:hypothetical protein
VASTRKRNDGEDARVCIYRIDEQCMVDGLCCGEENLRQPPGWMERLDGLYNGGTCFDGLHKEEERWGGRYSLHL